MKLYYIDRKTQIKHFSDLSILKGLTPLSSLALSVPAQEDFVIQLAALPENETKIVSVNCNGLKTVCINTDITDKFGNSYTKEIELKANRIQPLFIIIPADSDNTGKSTDAQIKITTDCGEIHLPINITFTNKYIENRGYNDIFGLSRLSWLNSTRYLNNDVVAPYTMPELNGSTVKILGRDIELGSNGLPAQVSYYFDESILLTDSVQKKLLKKPMEFSACGENITYSNLKIEQDGGTVTVKAEGESENLTLETIGVLRYDGSASYNISVTAKSDFTVENLSLVTNLNPDCAEYMNGLGAVGGTAHNLDFKWTSEKHHDCLYTGSVNAGLRLKWKAENYRKPLINIYYKNLPLIVPDDTWANHGKGFISFKKNENTADIVSGTGEFSMKKGELRHFDFEIHFTPLKPIDYKKHYSVRYSHNNHLKNEFKEVDRAAKNGLNNVVIHHGNMVHPFINYPFIETDKLKNLVNYAKSKNIGVKVYYTTREHSNHMAEVFAYKALGDEIILRKKGKGASWQGGTSKWLTDYFGEKIIPAWQVIYKHGKYKNDNDVSFIVRPNSRLDNYYIEGLDWLVKNMGIKGIYIDDTALDRTTLERAKKVLSQNNGLIDMHMWNHEEDRAGDVSCMNLYTELFPFLDSLWIGEGYHYKRLSPDYLLTEVSGIPYGQTSQMLEGGGNPYIGMLYAMNNRYGWGVYDAPRIYALWDSFGIQDSRMLGYWHSKNPVKADCNEVLATVYLKKDSALVCMFNFSDTAKTVNLNIDEKLLGFKVGSAVRPYIKRLQWKKPINIQKSIKLKGKNGVIIRLSK